MNWYEDGQQWRLRMSPHGVTIATLRKDKATWTVRVFEKSIVLTQGNVLADSAKLEANQRVADELGLIAESLREWEA